MVKIKQLITTLVASVSIGAAIKPYANCPVGAIVRGRQHAKRAGSAPGRLDAVSVDNTDGSWLATYHMRVDNIDNLDPNEVVREVKIIKPIQEIFFSENIPGAYSNDTNWFDFTFTMTFDGPSEGNCDEYCLPDVMVQYDYDEGGYYSEDYDTGCNSDSTSPRYCFMPCNPDPGPPVPNTFTISIVTSTSTEGPPIPSEEVPTETISTTSGAAETTTAGSTPANSPTADTSGSSATTSGPLASETVPSPSGASTEACTTTSTKTITPCDVTPTKHHECKECHDSQ